MLRFSSVQRPGAGSSAFERTPSLSSLLPILIVLTGVLAAPSVASASLNFTSHGGPVQTNPAVFEIYWGNAWNSGTPATERSRLQTMYNDFNESSGSGWQGIVTQYWAPEPPALKREGTSFKFVSAHTTIGTPYTDTTGPPSGVTKANMEAEVKKAIEAQKGAGGWPESLAKANLNDQFVLFTPPGTTWSAEVSKSACGEHLHSGESYVYARVAWEFEKEGSHPLCDLPVAASHEYAESVTDPLYNAWKEWGPEEEVADRCAFNGRGEFPGGIEVAKLWDNHSEKLEKCQASDAAPPQIAPEILTESATSVTTSKATLHGTVHENGLAVERGRFNWATDKEWEGGETYGHHTTFESGFKGEFTAAISSLTAETTYHFQLEVEDKGGFPEHFQTGKDQRFYTGVPKNTALPTASPQTPNQAAPESASTGSWTGEPTSYAYQWERCASTCVEWKEIAGANKSTYTPVEADVGFTLRVKVTAKNAAGEASATSGATNEVRPVGQITLYSLSSGKNPGHIAAGTGGYLWFSGTGGHIAKRSEAGTVTEYSLLHPEFQSVSNLALGPDGNMWYTIKGNDKAIDKVTPSGEITEYALPAGADPGGIAAGPDGNMWFTLGYDCSTKCAVAKITPTGTITEYSLPASSQPLQIAAGPDGNMWVTDYATHKIAKVTMTGTVTEYTVPSGVPVIGIAAGPDGNLWYTSAGVGKVTTSGAFTEYSLPKGSGPRDIALGPDGNLWYANETAKKIGRISTSGTITEYALPEGQAGAITLGPDGRMWFGIAPGGVGKLGAIVP